MKTRLPPLNALRAFEATSRLASAKHAAQELHVTPAAISHQIKLVENHLGIPLFKRLNRQLVLTDAGKKYATSLQDIFNRLNDETSKLKQTQNSHLTVTVEPAFAVHWLIPRLNKFKQHSPHIDLRISASYDVIDLNKNDIDIGIRWGKGKYSGLISTLLFRNEVYPVCNPMLLQKHPIKKPNDLKHHTLLHETSAFAYPHYPVWRTWLNAVGANRVNPDSGLYFETGYLLIQAAMSGQGIALERAAFVEPLIKAGQLVKLFDFSLTESASGYYLVFPENRDKDPKIIAFMDWLKSELQQNV